ncbi:MAG: alpha/beta hydrolase [Deltaproteobacteria bacterium]|nr:alpha/beta hydrolase [Deltaproteobacteria bacterium]
MHRFLALASLCLLLPISASCGGSTISGTTVLEGAPGGLTLQGTYFRQSSAEVLPTLILIHEGGPGHARSDFDPAWSLLENQGFNLLAVDLRSHGDSDVAGSPDDLRLDATGYPVDLLTWLDFLNDRSDAGDPVSSDRIGIIGLGVGASLAVGAIQRGQVNCAVAISPRVDEVEALRVGLPYLGAAGDDDDSAGDDDDSAGGEELDDITDTAFIDGTGAGSADDTQALYDLSVEPRSILLVDGPQSGALILDDFTDALAVVGAWCSDRL